jgi:hypothetical protein
VALKLGQVRQAFLRFLLLFCCFPEFGCSKITNEKNKIPGIA